MSGICGIVYRDQENLVNKDSLLPMARALEISGKNEGFTVSLRSAGFGVQKFPLRLAGIAKLSLHEQHLLLAFHGSLYNLRELSPSKQGNHDPVRGLLEIYLNEGLSFLERLRGDFVLAIWDGREEALHLATDRFRVHPLYYYEDHEKLIFASRIKGILASPFRIKQTLNPQAIVYVVASSIIPTPSTIFNEIKKIPSGHVLTYKKGSVKLQSYWEISFLNQTNANELELARELRINFKESLSICLGPGVGQNRIGTFLSGGVDSSTVTGVLTELLKHPVKCFSIGFEEDRFNEIDYARTAARAFNADHYEYCVTADDTYDAIPVLLDAFDEPYGNASAIPTYFCAKLAKEHGVDILYSGDGGDELFAGNERYAPQSNLDLYHKLPYWFRKNLLNTMDWVMADSFGWDLFQRVKKYIERATLPYHKRISCYNFFEVTPISDFVDEDFLSLVGVDFNPYEVISHYYFEAPASVDLDRHLYLDWKLTLADNDLVKVVRMSELAGVNTRFPFLDYKLVEFSVKVPAHLKMRNGKLRSFFKDAYSQLLPLKIREKKKHGFGLPIPVWLRADKRLNELMRDLVLSPRSFQRGYFKKKALERLVKDHAVDRTSFYGTVLWNLMVLELWHRSNSL